MIALDGELVTISKTWNNCVHYGNDNDFMCTWIYFQAHPRKPPF